jgi:hypothetical protein
MPYSARQTARRRGRTALVAGSIALAAVLVLAVAVWHGSAQSTATSSPRPTPTVDPRLIIRPRQAPVAATLSNGVRLAGTLYPAYPGRNTLHLDVRGHARLAPGSRIVLVATMPGMAMAPIHATLVAQGARYVGAVNLPMFGSYQAHLAADTPTGHARGTLILSLSLPRL